MFLSEEKQKERLDICNSCEFLKELKRCSKCGCIMPLKVRFKGAKCPIDKWGNIDNEDNV